MRFLVSLTALALLAACATAPAATAPSTDPAAPTAVQPSRAALLLSAAGRADAPTQSEIERSLGPPDVSRHDGAGAALTYRLDTCALLLLFSADERNVMRLREAHPSARRAGQAAPSLDQCAAEASARRS
jgi:hypothetical protein